ncbi:MAG TPA: hypothetical protein PKX27_09775 [Bacteroidales bacterium]|jgi:hypothetical protein|nr:hypothetical protein [Bacteroidales bacterium]HOX75564.1 hypothetical protein [Bacteroidales bacterium]HPM88263.1 hypothetical protein [Bacteroidales bacterium]HQM68596.1 hypothetical protein [Bacteroidales bacterium]
MFTTDQAIERLISRRGWYKKSGTNDSTARVYKKRFLENKLDLESRIRLLEACGYRLVRQMRWEDNSIHGRIKKELLRKLRLENAFWYGNQSIEEISDTELIEKVLMYLDLADIESLFRIFSKKVIKDVWKEFIIPLGSSYYKLNILFAFLYFNIKDPERYIRDTIRKRLISLK